MNSLIRNTAGILRRDLAGATTMYLPTLRDMARRYKVSLGTMVSAARLLRDEGLIEFGHGRRARRVVSAPSLSEGPLAPVDRCVRDLAGRIERGDIRTGAPLGKNSVLARELRVSGTTLMQALTVLAARRLIHKQGKRWRSGPVPGPSPAVAMAPRKYILLVQDQPRTWDSLTHQARTARFGWQFSAEVERYGVLVMSAFTMRERAPYSARCVDLASTVAYLTRERDRCLGVLVVATKINTPDLADWIRAMTVQAPRTVWYDRQDDGLTFALPRERFCRCHFNEQAAIDLAVSYLRDRGHRRLLYGLPVVMPGVDPWVLRRFGLLQAACAPAGMTIEALPVLPAVRTASTSGDIPVDVKTIDEFREGLRRFKPTAVVAPRDLAAYRLYHQLLWLGYRVPEDISLISFDNYPMLQAAPVSTIDFGMGHLGYCAFHYLFGVIPVRRGPGGDISARPHVVDRGSTALANHKGVESEHGAIRKWSQPWPRS